MPSSETPMQWAYDTNKNHAKVSDNYESNSQEKQSLEVVGLDTSNMAPKRSISTSQTKCTACSDSIDTSTAARIHPLLGVLICRKCYDSYGDGNFEQLEDGVDEAGDDNFCRWCVDGGDLFVCMNDNKEPNNDKCHYCFCRECLERNVPDDPILFLDSSSDTNFKWLCYACDPIKLAKLRRDAFEFIEKLTGKKAENLAKKRKTEDNPTFVKTKVPVSTHKPTITKKLSLTTSDMKIGTTSKTNVSVTSSKLDTSTMTSKTDTTAVRNKINSATTTKKVDTTVSSNKESTTTNNKSSTITNSKGPTVTFNLPPSTTGNKVSPAKVNLGLSVTGNKDVTQPINKGVTPTVNKVLASMPSNKLDTSIAGKNTNTTAPSNQSNTTTPSKEKSFSAAHKDLNGNQTSISSSSKENIPTPEFLKRLEVYRKTKDVTVEEISSKFDLIVDMVSKESSHKLLEVQIESLRTSLLEFETMINNLKSQLILRD